MYCMKTKNHHCKSKSQYLGGLIVKWGGPPHETCRGVSSTLLMCLLLGVMGSHEVSLMGSHWALMSSNSSVFLTVSHGVLRVFFGRWPYLVYINPGSSSIVRVLLGSHGRSHEEREPMGSHESPWENPWEILHSWEPMWPMRPQRYPMRPDDNPWETMITHGTPR